MRNSRALIGAALVAGLTGTATAQSAETQLIARLNEVRAQGVRCPNTGTRPASGALQFDMKLTQAAQRQAAYMITSGRITHTGPDGSSPRVRAASSGVNAVSVSEIIYLGYKGNIESAIQWWLQSPVHCYYMTDARYTRAGASVLPGSRGTAYVIVLSSAPR